MRSKEIILIILPFLFINRCFGAIDIPNNVTVLLLFVFLLIGITLPTMFYKSFRMIFGGLSISSISRSHLQNPIKTKLCMWNLTLKNKITTTNVGQGRPWVGSGGHLPPLSSTLARKYKLSYKTLYQLQYNVKQCYITQYLFYRQNLGTMQYIKFLI